MTKEAFSKDLGITPKTYNCYISGDPIPSTILEKLRSMTGRSIDYLLGLDYPDTGSATTTQQNGV